MRTDTTGPFPAMLLIHPTFRVMAVDPLMEQWTGLLLRDVTGRPCYEVFCGLEKGDCPLYKAKISGPTSWLAHKVELFSKSRAPLRATARGIWMRDEDGSTLGLVELFWPESSGDSCQNYTPLYLSIDHPWIQMILEDIQRLAQGYAPLLLSGEEGMQVAKLAMMIHRLSPLAEGPFIGLDCGAFGERMLEVELFGCKKDVTPEPGEERTGRLTAASQGSLFLQSIERLPKTLQARLVRYLDQGEVEPLGALQPHRPNARIISSCTGDPEEFIRKGNLMEALYLRLRPFELKLPPIREMSEGIPQWGKIIIQRLNATYGKGVEGISREAMRALMSYPFPGNLQELENVLHLAHLRAGNGKIKVAHLPPYVCQHAGGPQDNHLKSMEDVEREVILQALARNNWNRKKTAEDLGIDRTTLWRKLKKMGWGTRLRPI